MTRCAGCGRKIIDDYVQALGRYYHEACFVCQGCGAPIAGLSFGVHQGQPYHPDCLSKALGLRCAGCGELIIGKYTKALGKTWHPDHFVCAHCKEPISGRSFSEHQGQPYHPDCLNEVIGLRCAACGERIKGEYTDALGKAWHPEHFVCALCNKPISERSFSEHQGQVYHPDCLREMVNPRCAACGEWISSSYLEAMGKTWHPEHFVCTQCKKPFLDDGFMVKDGKPYCQGCFTDLFVTKCAICGQPMRGKYLVNQWGESFCHKHEDELQKCLGCERLISPALTGSGVQYADGRWMCNRCRRTAVDDMKAAMPAYKRVLQFLASLGVDLRTRTFPLELVDRDALRSAGGRSVEEHTFGLTSKTFVNQSGSRVDQWVDKISILKGMPWEQFTMVVAHELGHAWLCYQKIEPRDRAAEEGFCELLAYLWLEKLGTGSAKVRMSGMKKNPHRVYGRGLRRLLKVYQAKGLSGAIAAVPRE